MDKISSQMTFLAVNNVLFIGEQITHGSDSSTQATSIGAQKNSRDILGEFGD